MSQAADYEKEMANGKKFPFDKFVYCNIGNPHVLYIFILGFEAEANNLPPPNPCNSELS